MAKLLHQCKNTTELSVCVCVHACVQMCVPVCVKERKIINLHAICMADT